MGLKPQSTGLASCASGGCKHLSMPPTAKRKRVERVQRDPATGLPGPISQDEWNMIAKFAAKQGVHAISSLRLVSKWFAKNLRCTQIWEAYDELILRREAARDAATQRDATSSAVGPVRKTLNKWVRHAENRADLLMHRVYIEQCKLMQNNHLAYETARSGLAALREVVKDFGDSSLN